MRCIFEKNAWLFLLRRSIQVGFTDLLERGTLRDDGIGGRDVGRAGSASGSLAATGPGTNTCALRGATESKRSLNAAALGDFAVRPSKRD